MICDYDKSKFYIVSVDTTDLKTIEVPADIEWAMLVAYHRGRMETIKGTPLYEKYRKMSKDKDIIIGSEIELSYLERMFIQKVAEANRAKGVSLANSICKNYRREGLFFDEILEKAQNGG